MATQNATVRVIILWVVDGNTELKEMKSLESKMETQRPVFNLVSPVAQATRMAKLELKRKGEDSITDGGRKTATLDWNSLRY